MRKELQEITPEECENIGESLDDKDKKGRSRDWRGKKMMNELLSLAYDQINPQKAARLRDCSKLLRFRRYLDGTKKLESMNSCCVRLCPICSWRRSLKIYGQTKEIVDFLAQKYDYRYIMLTLTVKNCSADKLPETIDSMMKAWKRFMALNEINSFCKGWYRSLEITHDREPFITRDMYYGNEEKHIKAKGYYYRKLGLRPGDENPNYDLFHPHFHVLIAVNKTYFTSRYYVNQASLAHLWGQSLRIDYEPRVDIRCIQGATMDEINHAVCEVAKYACKDSDYIIPDDWDLTVNTVRVLDKAIDKRRLVAYGGVMKDAKCILKQDDAEDGDLVHVGDDDTPNDQDYAIISYWWYTGFRQYYEI